MEIVVSKLKSIIMKNKELLFNLAFLMSLVGFTLFLIRGYDAFKHNRKEPYLLSLALLALVADLIRFPYKWDKRSMKIQALLKLPIYITTFIFYGIPFFNKFSKYAY